ncbi:MAG TPA: nicotinate (nicotinamide) nucleotide adenylyltransferase [Candidatus Angelobacter sp.]|jgi:nicotinate-nucleotide adenylyltransferase|nr:nicotinate (nicotinamide) nucleotide adenylyltransferase [Candidatus Angelobacter sp.]
MGAPDRVPERVVVLGGTFDPIHAGHVAILEQVRKSVDAGEAWLLPTALPPHRGPSLASVEDRLAMARAAVAGHASVRVADDEARRGGPSYTIDTLDELERAHPGVEFWLTLGADAARDIGGWYRAADLLARARFVLVNRTGVPPLGDAEARALGFDPARTRLIHVDSPPVSATEIRRRVAAGEPLDDMVSPAVARIISQRRLYS